MPKYPRIDNAVLSLARRIAVWGIRVKAAANMTCCECNAKIEKDEDAVLLPGDLVICELCWNLDLDKPVSGEKEGTQTSKVSKEWWV